MPGPEQLIAEIAQEEARLANLRAAAADVRLTSLREQLAVTPLDAALPLPRITHEEAKALATNSDKVALFRFLLRGRQDLFPCFL